MTARWTFFDVIEAELRAVVEIEPSTIVLQPQIAYRRCSNGFTVAAGALYLHGDPISLGWLPQPQQQRVRDDQVPVLSCLLRPIAFASRRACAAISRRLPLSAFV